MLVLSRKVGESIQIGDDIRIIVNRISGNRITLAVDAPRSVKVIRGELASKGEAMKVGANTTDRTVPAEGARQSDGALAGAGVRRAIAVGLDFEVAGFAPRNAR